MSLGADVKQKLCNMVVWVAARAPIDIAPNFVHFTNKVSGLSATEAMLFAQQIAEALPDEEDFEALLAREVPTEVVTVLREVVIPNADMHDKFWRYMRYFRAAIFPECSTGE
tara:strand:+ start:2642 stop:2977 length:336 start_codon:yes stop_codon:yes gene_type:complete